MRILKILTGLLFIYAGIRWVINVFSIKSSGATPLIDYIPFILISFGFVLIKIAISKGRPSPKSKFTKIFCPITSIGYIIMFSVILPEIAHAGYDYNDIILFISFTLPVFLILLYDSYWIFDDFKNKSDSNSKALDE